MPTYSVSAITSAASSDSAYATFHNITERAFVREIRIFVTAATASNVGLIRSNNIPVESVSYAAVAYDGYDAAGYSTLDTAWSTAPTIGGNAYLRQSSLANVQGAYDVWTFQPQALVVDSSSFLVFWNYGGSTGASLAITVVFEE